MGISFGGLTLLVCAVKKFFALGGCLVVCVLGFVCGLVAVLGSVWHGFGALSMLSSVTFNVVRSDVFMLLSVALLCPFALVLGGFGLRKI